MIDEQRAEEMLARFESAVDEFVRAASSGQSSRDIESVAKSLSSDIDIRRVADDLSEILAILRDQQAQQYGRVRT